MHRGGKSPKKTCATGPEWLDEANSGHFRDLIAAGKFKISKHW